MNEAAAWTVDSAIALDVCPVHGPGDHRRVLHDTARPTCLACDEDVIHAADALTTAVHAREWLLNRAGDDIGRACALLSDAIAHTTDALHRAAARRQLALHTSPAPTGKADAFNREQDIRRAWAAPLAPVAS